MPGSAVPGSAQAESLQNWLLPSSQETLGMRAGELAEMKGSSRSGAGGNQWVVGEAAGRCGLAWSTKQ